MFRRKTKKRKLESVKVRPTPTTRGIVVPKPQTNIDTTLLGIALAAITIGCLLLLLEIFQYGGFGAVKVPA